MTEGVVIHPKGLCESDSVGRGTRVWAFAHVMAGAVVGEDCNIGGGTFVETGAVIGDRVTVKNNALIWDKVTIEDDAFIGPNVVFTNDMRPRAAFKKSADHWLETKVHRGATIGANATVVCGVKIGQHAFIGAGSVVTRDVAAHRLVVGNPARAVGWVCECGTRLDDRLSCPECRSVYRLISQQSGLRRAPTDPASAPDAAPSALFESSS